jgi:hypothetical protein
MATKPNHNAAKKDGWEPKGFVNLTLTDAQKKDAAKQYADPKKVEADWHRAMANGYRFTFGIDGKTNAVVSSVNCKDASNENSGWLLTSHAGDWSTALVYSLYKHFYILEEVWGNAEASSPEARYG